MPTVKILYVNPTAYIGGGEVSLLNLLKRLNRNIFYPVVIVPPSQGPLVDRLKDLNIEFKVMAVSEFSRYKPFSFLLCVIRLVCLIKKEKINLVHTNSIYSAEQGFFAAKLAGIPCVCHIRDLVPVLGAGKIRMYAFKHAAKLIAISEAVKKDLTEKLNIPPDKVVRIYNGVDMQEFHPGISGDGFRKEFNLGSIRLIGIIGRLSPEKGHELFLKAGAQIIKNSNDVRLVIIGSSELGSGDFKQRIKDLADKLNLKNRVIFTGFRNDLPEVLAALDIVVAPSREPFGRVIIEAMAMEKPVVAFRSGAAPEIINSGSGILVDPQDTEAFKDAAVYLLRNPDRCLALGRSGRHIVKSRFNIKSNVEQVENIYKSILDKNQPMQAHERP